MTKNHRLKEGLSKKIRETRKTKRKIANSENQKTPSQGSVVFLLGLGWVEVLVILGQEQRLQVEDQRMERIQLLVKMRK